MAPMSRELSGLILPHDNYGSHLYERSRASEVELERNSFEFVGKALSEI